MSAVLPHLPCSIGARWAATAAAVTLTVAALAGVADTPSAQAAGQPDDYEPTVESLESHPLPEWFDDAKFGIFIHWGAYSVPAWGPRGSYAEWYWNYLNSVGSPTYDYHRDTYGPETPYDAFIDQWKADRFDAGEWIELFNDAGAKYFVLTSKHHEGVALWDTATSSRDTVERGPHRDLAGELFAAAREDGRLKAGFYYSLYEWFNPAYTGRPVTNPYTGEEIPYTGVDGVENYVGDYMKPQMYELIDKYDPDIMWCDGEWERDSPYWDLMPVLAHYYNQAKNRPDPKEVVVANRCRIKPGQFRGDQLDFTTPEYEVEADINPLKWESSRGIANSYGYNRNEPIEDYQTSDELIDSLADIVSKNGNLLLNVGPRADGTIPDVMQDRLRDIGAWLDVNGEAIYGTTYFNHAEDERSNVPVRYTVKDGNLYAIALRWPDADLMLDGGLPVGPGSEVELLGSDAGPLPWTRAADGSLHIELPDRDEVAVDHAFAFLITTPGMRQIVRTDLELPDEINPGGTAEGTLTLTNTASTTTPDARVTLQVPDGWRVDPAAATVEELDPDETARIPVTVTVPASSESGDYEVNAVTAVGRIKTEVSEPVRVELPNVALGKSATQKSLGWDAPASRAVDGNTNGSFGAGSVTHTAEPESQAWWQVDLGDAYAVEEIAIWNRTDCCAQRLSDYWVMVSESPIVGDSLEDARTAPGVTATHLAAQAGRPTRLDLDGLAGRYVRVQLESDTNPLSLAEVQVRAAG